MLNGTPRIYRTAFASSARDTSAQITRTQLCGTVCRRLSITDEAYRRIMAIFVPYPYGRTRLLFTRGNRSTLILLLPSVLPSLPLLFFSLSFSFFLSLPSRCSLNGKAIFISQFNPPSTSPSRRSHSLYGIFHDSISTIFTTDGYIVKNAAVFPVL